MLKLRATATRLLNASLPGWLWAVLVGVTTFLGYTEETFEGGEE